MIGQHPNGTLFVVFLENGELGVVTTIQNAAAKRMGFTCGGSTSRCIRALKS